MADEFSCHRSLHTEYTNVFVAELLPATEFRQSNRQFASTMSSYRPQLLSLYKILLKYSKHIPKQTEKDATLTEIRSSFKDIKAKQDQAEIESFIARNT